MAKFNIKFEPSGSVVEVDTSLYPYGRHGEPGSLLDIALSHGVEIEHACGGAGVCGTCHVVVLEGAQNLSPAGDDEMDTVTGQPGSELNSRLACQAVAKGPVTVKVVNV